MKRYLFILSIIIITIMGLRFYFDGPGLEHDWERENFWLKKANTKEKFKMLILGDSRIYHAVQPEILAGSTDAINFGFSALTITKHVLNTVDPLIKDEGEVLLGLTAESLTHHDEDNSLRNYQKAGPLFIHQALKWIRLYWPSLPLQRLIKWGQASLFQHRPKAVDELYHDNGWIESNFLPTTDHQAMRHHYLSQAQKYKIDLELVDGIAKKTREWAKKGIKVYVFWTCFEESVCREEAPLLANGIKANIEQKLIAAGAHWLDVSDEKFKTFDGDHLTGPEAIRFSHHLKAKLRSH